MRILSKLMVLGAVAALPVAAVAQPASPSDLAYCHALSNTYTRYIGYDDNNASRRRDVRGSFDSQVAVEQCKQGDAAAAIPVLERELMANGFRLPARG